MSFERSPRTCAISATRHATILLALHSAPALCAPRSPPLTHTHIHTHAPLRTLLLAITASMKLAHQRGFSRT